MKEIEDVIQNAIKTLERKHREKFVLIHYNYFLSPSGILYSFFHDRLRFIKPSYKISRDGRARPTLRISVHGGRRTYLQYRLTAQYFSQEEIEGKIINHLDGDVYNVHPANLDVGDNSNNVNHAIFMNKLYEHIDENIYQAGVV